MSDRPPRSNDNQPDEQPDQQPPDQQPENEVETQSASTIDSGSGWQAPASGWRQPGAQTWRSPESSAAQSEVPALPTDLAHEPEQTGGWHRPKAEDTPFSDSDQIVVTTPSSGGTPSPADDEAKTESTEANQEEPQTPTANTLAAEAAIAPEDQNQSAPTAETAPESATSAAVPQAPEDMIAMLDRLDTDNDDDQFSMSELIALASLVDEEPRAEVRPSDAVPSITSLLPAQDDEVSDEDSGEIALDALSPAERAVLQQQSQTPPAPSNDPAEYARQQLAALGGTSAGAATEAPAQESTAGTNAEDYARQQLAELNNAIPPGVGEGTVPPTSGTAAGTAPDSADKLNPREEELARRFAETEEEVRTLRQMLNAGQITQFEEQLRNLMILDDDQVWWMIGAESDNWYKYVENDWVPATPPRLPSSDYYVNSPLPTLDSQPIPPAATGPTLVDRPDDIELDEYNMPVPRAGVPVVDPDRTMVGASYLDPYLGDRDRTVQSYNEASQPTVASAPVSDLTVASPAVAASYGAIEAPIVAAQPPSTDIAPYAPTYEEAAEAYRSNQVRNIVFAGLAVLGVVFLLGVGAILLVLSWYNGIVEEYEPGIAGLVDYRPQFQTVTLLDYRERPLATLSQAGQERIEVNLNDMSPYLIHAVITTQNPTFYNDPGWNLGSAIQAYVDNVLGNPIEDTDPTITQQVARSLVVQDVTGSQETMLDSFVVAGELTRRYDKNFILQLYLNESFFGNQNYGVEAASQFYFGIPAADLNIAQAAMLAGILEDPAAYDPVTNREAALAQMNDVLLRMGQVDCLNFQHGQWEAPSAQFCVSSADVNSPQTTVDKARVIATRFRPRQENLEYPHFVTLVRQQLETAFGATQLYSSGYTVVTSLVPELQDYAQDRLEAQLLAVSASGASQGAVIMTEPSSGYIRVYIGSEDFYNSANLGETDYARTYQQPGEAIQPVIYAAAFDGIDRNADGTLTYDEYLTPASIMWDVPVTYQLNPPFAPTNRSNQFYGPVPARIALAGNYNVSAVKALEFVTVDEFVNTSRDMGLRWEENAAFGIRSALGEPGVRLYDMMVAYGTMATGGNRVPLRAVVSIRDRNGNDVPLPDTLYPPTQEGALSNSVAFLLQNILSDYEARVASGVFPQNSPLTFRTWDVRIGSLPRPVPVSRTVTCGRWASSATLLLVYGLAAPTTTQSISRPA
jgi:membrane peptidoglycan carboxypeptidase